MTRRRLTSSQRLVRRASRATRIASRDLGDLSAYQRGGLPMYGKRVGRRILTRTLFAFLRGLR